jgi:hypothetical protein
MTPEGGATGGGGTSSQLSQAGSGGKTTSQGGGATSEAGSGGKPSPVVVVKTDCSKLPAPGTWENVSPPAFLDPSNMETMAVVVNPVDHTVFAAAGNKTNGGNAGTGVYRSDDCGANWEHVSTGTAHDKLETGDPWAMLIDTDSPQTMYINNGYGQDPTIYKSTNGGVDFTALDPDEQKVLSGHGNFVQAIALEKAHPQHVAVTFHDSCGAPFGGNCLSQSKDSGNTWHEFPGPSKLGSWVEAASLAVLGPTSYLYSCDQGIFFTEDEGKTWSQSLSGAAQGTYAGSAHLAPDGTLYLGVTNVGIFTSSPNDGPVGKVWSKEKLPTSPGSTSIITDDGTYLYASYAWDNSGTPFARAPLADPKAWETMKSDPPVARGSNQFAVDSEHHVVYSANWGAGLWRLVTQ